MEISDVRLFYLGAIALIAAVYAVKELALQYTSGPWPVIVFGLALAVAVPAAWALNPDWDNPHVLRVGILVGTPIALFAVPVVSFLFDLARDVPRSWEYRLWRTTLELLVIVPAWFIGWLVVEVYFLGWVWF